MTGHENCHKALTLAPKYRYMLGPIDKRALERGMPGLIVLLILLGVFLIVIGETLVAGLVFFIMTFVIFYRETRL